MRPLNWSKLVHRAWIPAYLVFSTVLSRVGCACPRDLTTEINTCFTEYSFHFRNMHNTQELLCCGLHVELLRAFCQSYKNAVECIKRLKESCPKNTHKQMDSALVNMDGARAGLMDLCNNDRNVEEYAMHATCYLLNGAVSQQCLRHFNSSSSTGVKFLSKVNTDRKERFCTNMRRSVACVEKNIESNCGEDAARLVPLLVKPMVRQSTDCDYSVINVDKKTQSRSQKQNNPAYISDGHTDTHGSSSSSSSSSNTNGRSSSGSNNRNRATCRSGLGHIATILVAPLAMLFSSRFSMLQ